MAGGRSTGAVKGKEVTLQEVAERAGVHAGTASRALNEATRKMVKAETVDRVHDAARQLGYTPNYLARSFKTRRTMAVGVVIPDITNPVFPPMVRGIEDRLAADGYMTLLANTDNDEDREQLILDRLLTRQVDGLVLATARRQDPLLIDLARRGIAVVLINRVVDGDSVPSVSVDDAAGIGLVVDHLVALGHRRIAHVAGPQTLSTGSGRYAGFTTSMKSHRLNPDRHLISFAGSFSMEEGLRCGREVLGRKNPPSAIVTANDMLALGCCRAVEEAGLRCPQDVSVVGFNDMPFIDRLNPPLTSVHIPHYEIGARAAVLMVERIETPDTPTASVVLDPELVVRGSTARAM